MDFLAYYRLCKEIDAAEWRQTVDGIQVVSEPLLNALWDLLAQVERSHPSWVKLDSPSYRKSFDVNEPAPEYVLC